MTLGSIQRLLDEHFEMWAIARPLLDLIDGHFTMQTQVLFRMSRMLQDAACLRAIAERMDQLDAG